MSKAENEAKPKLVEFHPGLFVFGDLQRNPSEAAEKLIEKIKEGAKRFSEQRTRGLIIASQCKVRPLARGH